jgi:hypothetical protein
MKVPAVTGHLTGSFTPSGEAAFDVATDVNQGSARSEGSFALTGTASFNTPCFNTGLITSATFPSGSFIIGTSVVLQIETDNGTVTFRGVANPAGDVIDGEYAVSGGTCDQTGTAVLGNAGAGQWDY